ncbi:GntR family transcriptional regulator [Micromonospora fulviviridis]
MALKALTGSRFDVLGGVPERTARDRVLALLVDAIRAGVFEVGDRLPNLRDLADELGISHVVARQAIEVLVECGVLDVRPGRGGGVFLVSSTGLAQALREIYDVPTPDEARNLLEARFVVQRAVVRRAVMHADARDLAELGALVSRMRHTRLFQEFTELTVRFHLRLALTARNVMLTSFLREVLNRMALYGMNRAGTLLTEDQVIERGCVLYEQLYEILIRSEVDAPDSWVDQHIHFVQDLYDFEVANSGGVLSEVRPV